MLGRVIIEVAEALSDGGNIALALDLISESLNNHLIDIGDVIEILQEIALNNDEKALMAIAKKSLDIFAL